MRYLVRSFSVWVAFFLLQRTLFLAYEIPALRGIEGSSLLLAFWHGLRFDASAACYILIIPLILRSAGFRFHAVMVVLCSLVNVADMGLYDAWGTKLSGKALYYLAYPKEIAASLSVGTVCGFVVLVLIQVAAGLYLLKRWLPKSQARLTAVSGVVGACLIAVGARGGPWKLPLTKADSYFSVHPIVNNAAVNGLWNIVSDAARPKEKSNPYRFFTAQQARKIVEETYKAKGSRTTPILAAKKPNIVIFMLESWSADVIGPLGGEKEVTPAFNRLAKDGLLFTNFYANGFRTEHGLVSIFGAIPAHPKSSIIRNFGKFERLPSLVRVLDAQGYDSAEYYGAELSFANTGSYFHTAGFKKITGEGDFPYKGKTTWGVYDEDLLDFQVHDLKTVREPFVALTLTITSHEPFDAPGPVAFPGADYSQKYRNSVHYTDTCLGKYFEQARREPWFKNTLFILLSDHSHIYPRVRSYNEPARYHIPMLFYGEVLKKEFRGKTAAKFGSQTDIAATVLSQLKMGHEQFHWSKDLLNPGSPSFSFYTFDDGFGWLDDRGILVYDHAAGKVVMGDSPGKTPEKGKAYLQTLFEEYLSY